MTFAWANASWNSTARADTFKSSVEHTVQELDEKGKSTLNEIAGAGTSSKIEGQVNKATGAIQEQTEKVGAELQGAVKQAQGQGKEDIGTLQEKMEQGSEQVKETSENAFDSIKSFLGQD